MSKPPTRAESKEDWDAVLNDDQIPAGLELLISFRSPKEMDEWLANKAALRELKVKFSPSQHYCLYNKETRLIAIIRR